MREKRRTRTALGEILLLCAATASILLFPRTAGTSARPQAEKAPQRTYLGFDANDYPGDDALPGLRRTFSFSGYWLNPPPGAKTNSWIGKRAELLNTASVS